ncbi:DUF1566 domain-containing protein [Pseudoxanthomonas sp. LH2527]|uniref:Lcl C-terminal domain-containing protein n=1 Tax=Pseudoxanthomonas sp. LH2527 TaxID=2923249 RepID=UPI001F140729|nr:DUF1566 domain-containing protein [Pseudoxanthomonas sp. LH2527]MCH6484278.1 DUF1566 domain-containing protein [Pseudoxanthomonas sp. LH2527]
MDNITIHAEHVTLNLHSADPLARIEAIPGGVTALAAPLAVPSNALPAARFTKVLADGTEVSAEDPRDSHVAVIDHHAGLMWSVESLGDPDAEDDGITQEHCIERCRELRLLDHADWRLPTRAELAGLVDDTRHEPAIDTNLFPRVKPRWHWTSTPCAWSSASAWGVDFSGGLVDGYHRGYDGFALAVRRVGQ